jgi:phospholipase D-like protein
MTFHGYRNGRAADPPHGPSLDCHHGTEVEKRWSELSTEQRAAVVGAALVQVGLLGAALRDLRRRRSAQVNGSRAMWAALSFVNFVGPLAYFAFGRRR